MRPPSCSSIILVSLVVSSSLSALAAPADCGLEYSSSFVPAAELAELQLTLIPPGNDDTTPQPNSEPPSYTHHHLPL